MDASPLYMNVLPIFGCIFFFSLHYLTRQFLQTFPKLSDADVYVIACRVVSGIQAVVASIIGMIIAYNCSVDIMKEVHWLTNHYVFFGIIYFPYDMWAMYAYNLRLHSHIYLKLKRIERLKKFCRFNVLMVIHHVVLPLLLLPVVLFLRQNRGDFFFGVFYMIEIVVPFISAREILVQLKMKNTLLYICTSLLMIVMFFLCRIAVFLYLYKTYANFVNQPLSRVPFIIPLKCNISCLLIILPQIYWFVLMVRGLYRVLTKSKCPNEHKENGKMC